MTSLLYHIIDRAAWQQAQADGFYAPESLASEGFIHCSTLEQVAKVANWFYAGQSNLLLLKIEPESVLDRLKWDAIETGEIFPHLYGKLAIGEVAGTIDFPCGADGQFLLPPDLLK